MMEQQTNFSPMQTVQPTGSTKPKNKKIGLFLLIGPIIGLIVAFICSELATAIFGPYSADLDKTPSMLIHGIINAILGLVGIICVIGVIVGIPMGIIYLNKKEVANNINGNVPSIEDKNKKFKKSYFIIFGVLFLLGYAILNFTSTETLSSCTIVAPQIAKFFSYSGDKNLKNIQNLLSANAKTNYPPANLERIIAYIASNNKEKFQVESETCYLNKNIHNNQSIDYIGKMTNSNNELRFSFKKENNEWMVDSIFIPTN